MQKPDTLEDLQKMLEDIVKGDGGGGVGGRASAGLGRVVLDAGRAAATTGGGRVAGGL